MTATTAKPEYRTDKCGFPVEACPRCGGNGRLVQYSNVYGGTCFGCKGSGWVNPAGKVWKLAAEFRAAVGRSRSVTVGATWKTETRETVCGLNVGDQIKYRGDEWRTVTSVKVGSRIIGESWIGGKLRALSLEIRVTFDDGETVIGWGIQADRKSDLEKLRALRDEKAAEARRLYEATLRRRASRAKRAS